MNNSKKQLLTAVMKWFSFMNWVIFGVGFLVWLYYSWLQSQLVFALVTGVPMVLLLVWLSNYLNRKRRDHYASIKENIGFLTYHEGKNKILLPFGENSFDLIIPSDEEWQRTMPAWAKDRKAEIMKRIMDAEEARDG